MSYTTFGQYQGELRTGSLFGDDEFKPIVFRPEQEEAITLALEQFCSSSGRGANKVYKPLSTYKQFLWNAKMRFGKTLCALELARRMGVQRTLIVTHRPVVDEGWHEDFNKIFHDTKYRYATRTDDEQKGDFYALNRRAMDGKGGFVFFVSMQFLRLSELLNDKTQAKHNVKDVGDDYEATNENERLKAEILKTDWDFVVVDEAHEGTRTALGFRVIDEYLKKKSTKMLHLSGTPFNLYEDFGKSEIFTWDYISEQQAKNDWPKTHPGEPNPYAELPQMSMYSYDLGKNFQSVIDHEGIFTFSEFFRTWTGNPKADGASMPEGAKGKFVHEDDVNKFLDLLCTKDEENNFPFATDEYRKQFRHTLWVVSRIDEAKALAELLRQHPKFKNRFKVINVAGTKESDEQMDNALDEVKRAIGDIPEKTATITISCGRLTTGVTIKPWTAVLYLKGGDRAATYLQTIFRVQSPYVTKDGMMKTSCCVFDFMFNRTLKIVAETSKFSSMAKAKAERSGDEEDDKTQEERDKETVAAFVKLCPLISMEGGKMSPLEVGQIYKQLESVFIDRLVAKGFDDPCLYVQEELNKIDPELLNTIGENGGQAPDERRQEAKPTVDLSHMTEEQRKAWEESIKRKKAAAAEAAKKKALRDEEFRKMWEGWTEEQRQEYLQKEAEKQAKREEARKQREEFKKRITNIRGIALRIPLLMYGGADAGDISEDLTVDNFTRKIKDESWVEFMPKGITKQDFNKIKRCFNATRFEEAGKRYRELTREADHMHISERIERITWIFNSFRNPDKETVLTPWRVVNMHMSKTLGGYCFFNERFDGPNQIEIQGTEGKLFDFIDTNEPRFVDKGELTKKVFGSIVEGTGLSSRVLEINSKTGLYPLYIAYTMYRLLLKYYEEYDKAHPDETPLLDNPVENLSVSEEHAIWDDVVTNNIYVICNTPMASHITRRTLVGFREPDKRLNIKSDKLVDRATSDQDSLVKAIKSQGYWNGTTSKTMINFDAVVGNPPYQETSNVNNRQNPIYHYFYDLAESLSGLYTLISPARFLFNAGLTPAAWNQKMLSDTHTKVVYYTSDSTTCFPNTAINGGVVIIMRNKSVEMKPIGLFLPDENLRSLASKFDPTSSNSLKNIIFGGRSDLKFNNTFLEEYPNSPDDRLKFIQQTRPAVKKLGPNEEYELKTSTFVALPYAFSDNVENPNEYYHLLGLVNSNRVWKYTKRIYMTPRYPDKNNIERYKVFISEADGAAGQVGNPIPARIIGKSVIGRPGDSATSSFISVGSLSTEEEAINCALYLRTKFVRCLIGILKITQHNPPSVWAYVPKQDFTSSSDIDWQQPIEQIDAQLYAKYNLSNKEIDFIEKMIAPLE